MNLNDPRHPWARLAAAARRVEDGRDTSAPYGFATRVTALAWAQERKVASLLDVLALRALGVAALLAVLSVAVNYSDLLGGGTPRPVDRPVERVAESEIILPTTDAVAVLLDIAVAD